MGPFKLSQKLFRVGNLPTSRIEAFSDGVFAIVATLLILEIHVPKVQGPDLSAALVHSLVALAPKYFTYALSFIVICIWWVAHHHLLHLLKKSDRGLLWLNSLFLMLLAFIPFPAGLMGDYPNEPIAVAAYGLVTVLTGICFAFMRYYAFYIGELVDEKLDRNLMKRAMVRSMTNPALHAVAAASAYVDTRLAMGGYCLLALLYIMPGKLDRYAPRKT